MIDTHLLYGIHTTGVYGAFTTPTKAAEVENFKFEASPMHDKHNDTGARTRAAVKTSLGPINNGKGTVSGKAYPNGLLPHLMRSFLTSVTTVSAGGSGFQSAMRPNDLTDIQLPWFSFVEIHRGVRAYNVRGGVVSKLGLSCKSGESLKYSSELIIANKTEAGRPWFKNGTTNSPAAPTVDADTWYNNLHSVPLWFHEGSLKFGGTVAEGSNGALSVTTPSSIGTIDSFSMDFELSGEGKFSIRKGDPTIDRTRHNDRNIALKFDIDWEDTTPDFYRDMQDGVKAAVELDFLGPEFESGENYQMKIVLPIGYLPQGGAETPDGSGERASKMQSITMNQLADTSLTNDADVCAVWTNLDNLGSV